MKRIRHLLVKELTQIRRDRRLFGILIAAPVMQLILLGFAANTDVREIKLAVRDNDHTMQSREFTRALGASGWFQVTTATEPAAGDGRLLASGRAGLVAVIPPGFGKSLARGEPATVQALVDGADSNFAVQGAAYLQRAAHQFSEQLVRAILAATGPGTPLPQIVAETRIWYNPDLLSRWFMVPALMGVLLLVTTMIVSSMALVKEREEGTLEQLIVTPLRVWELIAGKLLPFVVIGFGVVTLALPVMLGVFGVPLRGHIALLYLLSGVFLLTTLGLGLFVSTLVHTQQQAMLVAGFFVMMPFVLLSGFIFPVENMPKFFQILAQFIPLKYYLTIVRGIFLKGVGLDVLWRDALILLLWGFGILGLSALKFRKRLD
ncbi:MAG: ABC transporter permease [Verrucomicrobia bacterium]|nr:MAG: ABC transporter permease [Verrucomicrobiota bacterium]